MLKLNGKIAYTLLALLGMVLFLPFLGSVHLFDWDEINFAECAREMLVTGNYTTLQMNFFPFWEKPPLFIWMQALSMEMFGVNEFAARFPNAFCGIVTLLFIFKAGQKIKNTQTAWLWVMMYVGSFLPQFYFHSGIIDPWFNLFIFSAFYFFVSYLLDKSKFGSLLLAGVCAGLALLTKGPAAIIILGLVLFVFQIKNKNKLLLPVSSFLLLLLIVAVVGGLWFLVLLLRGQQAILTEFVSYQYHLFHTEDSGHGGPWFYHIIVLLVGCFPASIFALKLLFKSAEGTADQERYWLFAMRALLFTVLILFSVVQTKIVHYSSLCYFPLTFLAAYQLNAWIEAKQKLPNLNFALLLGIGLIYLLLFIALPLFGTYSSAVIQSGVIKDDFAVENLKAEVTWSAIDYLSAAFALAVLVLVFTLRKLMAFKQIALFVVLLIGMIESTLVLLVPKIEAYTQRVVIDFYKDLQGKDCYATSLNYLSYAPPFYAQKRAPAFLKPREVTPWLLNGAIDKDAYFVSKVTDVENYSTLYPQLIELKRSNGFVFYRRKASK